MRNRFLGLFLLLLCPLAMAQTTTITASQIQNNLSGTLLASGYFELVPVNAQGAPTGFTAGGGGQVLPVPKYWPIFNGAIGGVVVPDTSLTTPSNVGYQVTVTDSSKIALYTFSQPIHPTGSTWSFDAWSPTTTVIASPANAVQNSTVAPTGPCSAPSIFYYGTTNAPQTITLCVGGTYQTFAATGAGVTWPASADLLISNSSNSPAGLAPVNGDCVIGSGGAWIAGSCGAGSSGFPITLGSTSLAASSTTAAVVGLEVNGVNLTAADSSTTYLNGAGNYTTPAGSMVYPDAGIPCSTGSAWCASYALADFLQVSNNLSDLANASTARTNLGLGSAAQQASSAFDAAGAAATAQANAEAYAANSSNQSSGTVPAARLPAALANSTSVNGTNIPASVTLTQTVASGTAALGTSAIASGACATVVTVSASGVAATDAIAWTPNASIKLVTGYAPSTSGGLSIAAYPTSGDVNFDVCKWSAASITPGAVTLNWRVTR